MLSVGIAVLLCVALWAFWPRPESSRPAPTGVATSGQAALAPAPADPSDLSASTRSAAAGSGSSVAGRRSAARQPSAEQQQLRERVVRSLRQGQARSGAVAAAAAARAAGSESEPARTRREGTMKDKTGLMGDEVKVVNRELMPMVAECVDEAQARDPRLHGMLALGVKLASTEGVGSIFESLEPTDANEVRDPALIDCIRQSAFTVSLPMPKANSLHEGVLTIPVDPVADAGAPSPT
jgi:hypothetical protein